MEYFYITQDKRYRNSPEISNFYHTYYPNLFTPKDSDRIPDKNVVYCENNKTGDMIDVISGPVFFISDAVKKVFTAYDDTICFKLFFLLNIAADQGGIYYTAILPQTDCLKKDKTNNKLHLNREKMADRYVCQAAGDPFKRGLIINMDIAESLLRRKLKGINYERLEVEPWQNIL